MKRVLTGIKASGKPHLGNYFGAIKPALDLSLEAQKGFFFIADYHALTLQPSSKDFQDAYRDVAQTWLACGLDPQKHFFYRQSQVPEIFELYWILSCFTPKGFMNRAHVYKSLISGKKNEDKIQHGTVLLSRFNGSRHTSFFRRRGSCGRRSTPARRVFKGYCSKIQPPLRRSFKNSFFKSGERKNPLRY